MMEKGIARDMNRKPDDDINYLMSVNFLQAELGHIQYAGLYSYDELVEIEKQKKK